MVYYYCMVHEQVQTGIGNKSGYTIGGKAVYRDGFVFMEVPVAQVRSHPVAL